MTDSPAGGPDAPEQPNTDSAPEARPETTIPGTPTTPTTPAPSPTPAPDARPRPEYGEYAPEGWEWKPEGDAAPSEPPSARPGGSVSGGGGSTPASVHGVPHNLGAGTALPGRRGFGQGGSKLGGSKQSEANQSGSGQGNAGQNNAGQSNAGQSGLAQPGVSQGNSQQPGASQHSSGAPYRAAAPGQPDALRQAPQYHAPTPGPGGFQQKPVNMGDRVVTILLLVVGAFGALYSTLTLMGLRSMFVVLEDAPGITELNPPAWVDIAGKVGGIALLVFYGLVLVFSIRRMRARKITFWAPLAAGVLATVAVFAIMASAMVGTPELMQVMTDPQASTELLEYLQGFPTS